MNAATGNEGFSKTTRDTPKPGDNSNPRDLERDSDEIRADMDRTLEALERKFSPREVVQRSVGYVREHGAEVAQEIGETVRRNPVPVVLTVAGIAWLTAAVMQDRSAQSEEEEWTREDDDRDEDEDLDQDAGLDEGERGEGFRGRLKSAADRARGKASDAAHRMRETMQSRTVQARNSFGQFVQEQPLVVGMIALTAGALLGASLPVTEYERRTLAGSGSNGGTRREPYGTSVDEDIAPTPTV